MNRALLFTFILAAAGRAQLTTDQRLSDFRNLADLYARRYAALQWKKTVFNFDALDLTPWNARISGVKNDLDFYDLMVEYVSDLNDAHDQYWLPSDFEAYLGFTVDIYDGKVLIDSIDQSTLTPLVFPAQIGDQIVSVDGTAAADLIKLFSKYVTGGNPRTVQRLAAELITDRYQDEYPYAPQIGDAATVVVLRQSGATETYSIPWQKSGTPLTGLGASPGPSLTAQMPDAQTRMAAPTPYYRQLLDQIHTYQLPGRINVLGFDELAPVFQLPASFVQRLGKHSYDPYYSGTYTASDGTRIGYLRIPDFLDPSLTSLDKEITFFNANTDVLVVDVMRNPGGDACSAEDILSRLASHSFSGAMADFRVDWTDIVSINEALASANDEGADADTIAQLQLYQNAFMPAFQNNAGLTQQLPLCSSTGTHDPATVTYSKPVLVLVDEMTASSGDIFAAMVQDNHVAPLFGYRTMGAGGSPEDDLTGVYSEGETSVTRSLVVRPQPIVTTDYPTTSYIENVGVRPETVADYMTTDNLLNGGKSFVDAFTAAATNLAGNH